MKHTLDAIILAKRELRKELAALPFEQKWTMIKKMRARNDGIAGNPLRHRVKRPVGSR